MHRKRILCSFLVYLSLISWGFSQTRVNTERTPLGKIEHPDLNELSGIIVSRNNPKHFWVHNDSGDKARFFLIDSLGHLKKTIYLQGIVALDIEDIAWVELNGKSTIILADIGDNRAKRENVKLYVFEEPKLIDDNSKTDTLVKEKIETITLQYDGGAKDAEAIFVDPISKELYIISKREFKSALYKSDVFISQSKSSKLVKQLEFPFSFITAADISMKGDQIICKNLTNIYYWFRREGESISESMKRTFFTMAYASEPQGEAVAFDVNTSSFFTVSERPFGLDSYLYQYNFIQPKIK